MNLFRVFWEMVGHTVARMVDESRMLSRANARPRDRHGPGTITLGD